MMCYMDKTFCKYYSNCKEGHKCDKAFTPGVKRHATQCGMYVSQYVAKPDCYRNVITGEPALIVKRSEFGPRKNISI